jgi:proline iminopeptidase
MEMPGGHRVYVEQCGKPDGVPVVVLHGGPGGGCSPGMRRFFDPSHYRVVLFDQRGCGRSSPNACVENNTTWDLVADIERIRTELRIDRWAVFGGSWGACLGLIYAQTHPERVKALVLRGVFTMTRAELRWFYGGGAGGFWPEQWKAFAQMIPEEERHDLIGAYHRRLFGPDQAEQTRFARAWAGWESSLAVLDPGEARGYPSSAYSLAFARLENHYFINGGFLDGDGHILRHMGRIAEIPGHIVQGRYDMICPPHTAHALHQAWPGSTLRMVTTAGHALSEPGISAELVGIMDGLRA